MRQNGNSRERHMNYVMYSFATCEDECPEDFLDDHV